MYIYIYVYVYIHIRLTRFLLLISQSQLTLQHYENRSQSAYTFQKCIRKIVQAARIAEKKVQKLKVPCATE